MWIGGGLLLLALAALTVALRFGRRWRALRRVEVTTPERLVAAARAGRLGRRICAVAGTAGPGSQGELVSTVNHEPCVWHRHTIRHRQVRYRTDASGRTRRSSSRRRAGDVRSLEPFRLDGEQAHIEVQPAGMPVIRPQRRPTRILPGIASQPFPEAALMAGGVQNFYRHREWIIQTGTRLLVLGEVGRSGNAVVIRRATSGANLVSTLDSGRLLSQARLASVAALAAATVAATLGVVLIVLG